MTGPLKKLFPYLLTLLLIASYFVVAAPVSRPEQESATQLKRWYSMEEAQVKASSDHKKVLVQIYTDSCTPCKKMSDRTYQSDSVSTALNRYFYPVKIDGASSRNIHYNGQSISQHDFIQSLGISDYPATVFIASNGEIISQQGGFIKPGLFTKLLYYIGSNAYQRMEFDQFSIQQGNGRD